MTAGWLPSGVLLPGAMVRLVSGEVVSTSAEAWRLECLARSRHVQTLLSMRGQHMRDERRRYVDRVQVVEGDESARRLREALQAAWPVPSAVPSAGPQQAAGP